ncbi:acetyltransferase [Massilia sp. Dwa41.01b]|uniref:acetyltransferase n=1 Tax=unclassified Massilia TaxID=2609279 RepID=UPI0016039C4B|nr:MULTISPECIES: acetyltransferase [unclassified Massilia]QNA89668.1 acetyltransferase [Massilia sp. Dwa41.01b]QNB00564.1 acetyltransferase [Massilia sp. Se16.2.3]
MQLAILGASGHGKVVADTAVAAGWERIVFFDDAWPGLTRIGPWEVAGDTAQLLARIGEFDGAIVAIGNCTVRMEKHDVLLSAGGRCATIIHPRAWVSPHAVLGAGCVVMAGAVVNIDSRIGDAGIVNTGATVDHDCMLGTAVHISPGAHLSGNVHVGAASWIGVGAAVRQGIRIGAGAMVGAGAVVVNPVPDGVTVVGNPARPIGAMAF